MTMRTRDDVLLFGTGKCATPECLSDWAKICLKCNLSLCGAHVDSHSCGAFQRPAFSGQGTPGAVRRSDVVSGGPGEKGSTQRPQKGRSNAVKSVHRNGKNGRAKK